MWTCMTFLFTLAAISLAMVTVLFCLYDFFHTRRYLPSLYYLESHMNSCLLDRLGLRHRTFSPAFWLRCGHVQSLLAGHLECSDSNENVKFRREYLQTRDNGVVALDWVVPNSSLVCNSGSNNRPSSRQWSTILILIPPVVGDAFSVYPICCMATKRGIKALVFNRRGHGNSVLTTPKLLSSCDPTDLRQVLKYLQNRCPNSRLVAVSYGTGCSLLISYLGEFGSSAILEASACVSPCYDDDGGMFKDQIKNVYAFIYLLKLKAILLRHAKALSAFVDVKRALCVWNFREYDEQVYFQMYKKRSSSVRQSVVSYDCVDEKIKKSNSFFIPSNVIVTTTSTPAVFSTDWQRINSNREQKLSGQKFRNSNNSDSVRSNALNENALRPQNKMASSSIFRSFSLSSVRQHQQSRSQNSSYSTLTWSNPKNVEEYLEWNNPLRDVDDIAVPVLCINSLDDPTFDCKHIPYDLFQCCPNFLLVTTNHGGHCGFYERFSLHSWADCLCLDYVDAVLDLTMKKIHVR